MATFGSIQYQAIVTLIKVKQVLTQSNLRYTDEDVEAVVREMFPPTLAGLTMDVWVDKILGIKNTKSFVEDDVESESSGESEGEDE